MMQPIKCDDEPADEKSKIRVQAKHLGASGRARLHALFERDR